jgi:hypothetical protein
LCTFRPLSDLVISQTHLRLAGNSGTKSSVVGARNDISYPGLNLIRIKWFNLIIRLGGRWLIELDTPPSKQWRFFGLASILSSSMPGLEGPGLCNVDMLLPNEQEVISEIRNWDAMSVCIPPV